MLGLITGAEPPPPCTILAADGSTLANPAFDLWYDKDQSLMIWIISTLSSDLLSHTVGIETSRALWELLEKRFAGVSRATIHQLRSHLQTLTKEDLPMITYLQQMKEIAAGLGAASHPLTDADFVAYILAGLLEEYDSFVTSIETRSEPVSSDELHGFLLGREAAILQRKTCASLSVTHEPFHAYAALSNSFRSSQEFSKNHGRGRSHFPSQFQPRSLHSSNHDLLPTPLVSWMHGSNLSSSPSGSGSRPQFFHGGSSSGVTYGSPNYTGVIVCQFCDKRGHGAATCRKLGRLLHQTSSASSAPYSGYYVNPQSQSHGATTSWIMDTGATAHVIADNSHLQNSVPYTGSDSLQVEDGNCLPISHIGSPIIETSSAQFALRNILHVPHITQNLLSVQKFLEDNQCSLTLSPSDFVIKDLAT